MRNIRVAAMTAAAVGLGVYAVGCGPLPSSVKIDSSKVDPSKVAAATGKIAEGADKLKEMGEKVKATTDEITKELTPLKDAFEKLKAKIATDEKAAGTDAGKLSTVEKLKVDKDSLEKLFKDITDKLAGFKDLKDLASLDGAKKAIMEIVEKIKPMLKDYLPAAK
jgi:flagellar motility protein MotE (MotC chaperone)